jgi:hypothetical protein
MRNRFEAGIRAGDIKRAGGSITCKAAVEKGNLILDPQQEVVAVTPHKDGA